MLKYRVFYKRPASKKTEAIREFNATNFHVAYKIATNEVLEQVRKEMNSETMTIVMLAQLPK